MGDSRYRLLMLHRMRINELAWISSNYRVLARIMMSLRDIHHVVRAHHMMRPLMLLHMRCRAKWCGVHSNWHASMWIDILRLKLMMM